MRTVLSAAAGALSLCLAAAGCADSIAGADPETGLRVEVRKGPIAPVGRPGEENSAPVEGARVRVRGAERGGSVEARTGADGTVRVLLVPARYRVTVEACPGALGLPDAVMSTVRPGEIADARLTCDTGIR